MRRYPLAALVAASGLTEAALARRVGLSGTTLKNAREIGLLERSADRYAIRAGLHPFEVWPEIEHEALVECAAEDCGNNFLPTRKGHSWCSSRCRERVRTRMKYRTDPAFREQKRQARVAFYREVGYYERARERRKYEADPDQAKARSAAYYAAHQGEMRAAAARRRAQTRGAMVGPVITKERAA